MKLTEDEQRLLDSVERGEWQSIPDVEREAERYRAAARATMQKDKRVINGHLVDKGGSS